MTSIISYSFRCDLVPPLPTPIKHTNALLLEFVALVKFCKPLCHHEQCSGPGEQSQPGAERSVALRSLQCCDRGAEVATDRAQGGGDDQRVERDHERRDRRQRKDPGFRRVFAPCFHILLLLVWGASPRSLPVPCNRHA